MISYRELKSPKSLYLILSQGTHIDSDRPKLLQMERKQARLEDPRFDAHFQVGTSIEELASLCALA